LSQGGRKSDKLTRALRLKRVPNLGHQVLVEEVGKKKLTCGKEEGEKIV